MAVDFKSLDKKKVLSLAISVVVGLIAVGLTASYVEQRIAEGAGSMTKKQIGIMQSEIGKLHNDNQQLYKTLQAVSKKADAAAKRQPARTTEKKMPTLARGALSSKTPAGYRAIAVNIDSLSAVGGLLMPGDSVDIITHLKVPTRGGKQELTSITLFQNVLVLSVNGKTQVTPESSKVKSKSMQVTFALNPQEAELLTFAERHGKLQLVLRSPLDSQAFMIEAATWKSFSDYVLSTQGTELVREDKNKKKPLLIKKSIMPEPDTSSREANIEVYEGGQYKGLK